jgi:hypothetical protein
MQECLAIQEPMELHCDTTINYRLQHARKKRNKFKESIVPGLFEGKRIEVSIDWWWGSSA